PTGGPLHVGGGAVEPEVAPVAAFAAAHAAEFVITGWVDRPSWQLRIGLALWKGAGPAGGGVAPAPRTGGGQADHQLLGEALGEVWSKGAGIAIDDAHARALQRALAADLYAVTLMGRGLGHLVGALPPATPPPAHPAGSAGSGSAAGPAGQVDLKAAEHDLERAVFIDPKCFEAQRLLGELYRAAPGDPRAAARALAKFNYANDLAPDDIASLRAAATGAAEAGKHELALELFRRLVIRRPWDLDARYELGSAMWRTGDAAGAPNDLRHGTPPPPRPPAARPLR